MNVLIIYAHPEPRSLNGSLKDFAVEHLTKNGHDVRVSDLYAMGWKAVLDAEDFPAWEDKEHLLIAPASAQAYADHTQTLDVEGQQTALLWADAVIFQFPLWWFSMPAIMKGWVDRVYAFGFGYGVGEHSETRWGDRYGEGTLQGKRGMLIVTMGGWESHYGERGVNGPIEDLLFPIHRGVLHYPGFDVMEPFLLYKVHSMDAGRYATDCAALSRRLDDLWTDTPIPYRKQNGGDYEIPSLTLKPTVETKAADGTVQSGFRLHIAPLTSLPK